MKSKIKMWAKIIGAFLFMVLSVTLWLLFVRRKAHVNSGVVEFQDKLEKAKVDAALEIGIAKGKEEAIKEEIEEIREIDDRSERLKRLSDLVNRTSR